MATHSGILAWRIQWTKKPGELRPMGSQRVGHDIVTKQRQNNGLVKPVMYLPFPSLPVDRSIQEVSLRGFSLDWLYHRLRGHLGSFLCISFKVKLLFSQAFSFLVALCGGLEVATDSWASFPLRGVLLCPLPWVWVARGLLWPTGMVGVTGSQCLGSGLSDCDLHLPLPSPEALASVWKVLHQPVAAMLWGSPSWSLKRCTIERCWPFLTAPAVHVI